MTHSAEPPADGLPPSPANLVPTEALISQLYQDLRALAAARMAAESPAHTLTPTALVHEVYVRLAKEGHGWATKAQFFAASAEAMRRVLVDWARAKGAEKRGGKAIRVSLDEFVRVVDLDRMDWLALDEALKALAQRDQRMHQIVMLRFFAGLTCNEAAAQLGLTEKTVDRDWSVARLWLQERLSESSGRGGPKGRTSV